MTFAHTRVSCLWIETLAWTDVWSADGSGVTGCEGQGVYLLQPELATIGGKIDYLCVCCCKAKPAKDI